MFLHIIVRSHDITVVTLVVLGALVHLYSISLTSTFLHTSVCLYRTISLVFFTFLRTLVNSHGISLVSTFLRIRVERSHPMYYCCYINRSCFVSYFVQYLSYFLSVSPYFSSFVQYLSYLLSVSPYVSSFVQYLSYLLNVSLCVIAIRC